MELRVLNYFLMVAKEESISGAANVLHLSQPTLSRQLKDMEFELGKQLFIRGSKKIELTDEGRILKKRAEEIIALVEKTENEITVSDEHIAGDVFIGAGETVGVRFLTKAAKRVRDEYPDIHFHDRKARQRIGRFRSCVRQCRRNEVRKHQCTKSGFVGRFDAV